MSEINVLKGRKFEDCFQEYLSPQKSDSPLREILLERLGQLKLGANPNAILVLASMTVSEADAVEFLFSARELLIERVDLITRTLFNQSLFESTQADIEAEAALRDAENEYLRAKGVAEGAFAKYNELHVAYQEKVEDVTA